MPADGRPWFALSSQMIAKTNAECGERVKDGQSRAIVGVGLRRLVKPHHPPINIASPAIDKLSQRDTPGGRPLSSESPVAAIGGTNCPKT